jgi:hypothetical protein
MLGRWLCVANKKNGGGGSSSSSSSSASATATANVIAAEVSSCELDGKAHGIQQKFDSAKYRACGSYPNAQLAYSNGFITGCTQVGNTQQLCQAFVNMNTQPQTQPNTQSTTQPTQPTQTPANNTINPSNTTIRCKLMSSHCYTNILTIVPIPDDIEKDDLLVESLVEL